MNARPESLEAMIGNGFDQLKLGQYEDAIDAFSAALAVYPDTAKAFLGRGISRFQIKKWKEAEGDFRRARELDAHDPESHVGLGLSLAMQDHIYPALEVLEKLLAGFPNFVRGYIQLGMLHIKIGTINKGRDYLQQALEHRPSLEERKFIESTLKEQEKLDAKRYYRPDFEALRRKQKD